MSELAEWGVPIAVTGLLLATLFMASVVKRYQIHQAEVRAAVRRIEAGLQRISHALAPLSVVPLSREIRVTLRGDVLARYQRIRKLFRRYPGIDGKIAEAEAALKGEGAPLSAGVGPIDGERQFRDLTAAIDDLMEIIGRGMTLQTVPQDVRAIFCRELGERRAEILCRFHLVAANGLVTEGDQSKARSHLTTLMHQLRQRGPSSEFVRELYIEAEKALEDLSASAARNRATKVAASEPSEMAG